MTAARFQIAIGLATLLMLALSWPLWVDGPEFPRVPFFAGLPVMPAWVSGLLFASLMVALAAGVRWRGSLGAAAALLVVLIAEDQHRFQPWAYQFLMAALALATTSAARAAGLCRLFLIALYFHSGLSKLDVSFCRELGPTFLETAARPIGLHPSAWPPALRTGAALAMPAAEVVIAAGLAWRRTRQAALAGAIALHMALIAILGPWGLGHSAIVLVWNAALIVEDVILFGFVPSESLNGGSIWGSLTAAAFVVAAVLPFGERWGACDTWPAFALYASHAERVEIALPEAEIGSLPESIRRHLSGEGTWRRLDLTAWSRAVRGVPVYPQGRACVGLAEALAARYRGARALRVSLGGRADRWTGRRDWAVAVGRAAIHTLGDRFRLNAHPAGPW